MNQLYGIKYLENQRSSGYKSTVYAMAEIVDNSVDANANKIQIVFSEKDDNSGPRKKYALERIAFIDNGIGMTSERLNGCLTFAEGAGKSEARIGSFGVGLPNSSISVCRRVEVYSRTVSSNWQYVCLDLDEQQTRPKPGYDIAINKIPSFNDYKIPEDAKTIVIWSKLDRLDVARAKTLIDRASKLLGRIYRYKIQQNLEISLIETSLTDNSTKSKESVIPYDPLFVMEKLNYITEHIWKAAENDDPKGKTPDLGHLELFNSRYYYKKFINGCAKNKNLPLFQKFDDYWDVCYKTSIGGAVFPWSIRASFATSDISNPGVRSGGGTRLGIEFGKKSNGDSHFPSGNIFFIRAGREIDFGNFGLYAVTDEKNRFWTIEIHFGPELDELMGLSNDKQSVKFKAIKRSDLSDVQELIINKSLGAQREILWSEMTETMARAITEMKKSLSEYARNFKELYDSYRNNPTVTGPSLPTVEPPVMNVIPRGGSWTEDQQNEIAEYLRGIFLHIPLENIKNQIKQFSAGLTKTIVLYAPNETGKLFELIEKKGKLITLINTNHLYYQKVIQPLKSDSRLRVFAISIELLISSFSLEMSRLMLDNPDKYEDPLKRFLLQVSSRLEEFINDSNIEVRFTDTEEPD
jgi:hypothetical protein